jgi:hypothetical protein
MSDDEPRYDVFISYTRKPDYSVARLLETFLESFHTIDSSKDNEKPLRVLSVCRDGGDFSLSAARKGDIEAIIRPYLDRSDRLLVLCSENAGRADWVAKEIDWFLEKHDTSQVILGVTDEGANVFPQPILARGLQNSAWYDFRGARAKKGHPYQDFDEARVQLAADLNGQSAGAVWPLWKRQQEVARNKRHRNMAVAIGLITMLLIVAAIAFNNARMNRRAAAALKADDLATRAESYAAPGPDMDVVRAFHLAVQAALQSPARDPRTPLHVARVVHIAATLPTEVVKLQQVEHNLQDAIIAGDGRYVLATNANFRARVWDAMTGAPKPLPFPQETILGDHYDDGLREADEVLKIDSTRTIAAANFDDSFIIWNLGTGRALANAKFDIVDDRPLFSADALALVSKSRCADQPFDSERCCWKVLWKQSSDAAPSELAKPCTVPKATVDDESRPKMVYRGRRPTSISDNRFSGGEYETPAGRGTQWAGFAETSSGDIVAVSPAGWVFRWPKQTLFVQPLFANDDVLDAKLEAFNDALWIVTKTKRIARVGLDGKELWSAPFGTQDARPLREARLWETSDDGAFLVTYAYGDEYAADAVARIELWRAGAQNPQIDGPFRYLALLEVVLNESGNGGWIHQDGEDESDYLFQWRFRGNPPSKQNTVRGEFLGFTRDGAFRIERDQQAFQLVATDPKRHSPAPFRASDAPTIAFLKQVHGIRETADGITATLPGGQELKIVRAATGARLEIDGHPVRASGNHIDAEAQLMASERYGVTVSEADSKRVIAAHFARGSILGFTKDGHSLILGGRYEPLQQCFIRGDQKRAPDWLENLAAALTRTRMLEDETLEEIPLDQWQRIRATEETQLRKAARAGDRGAALLSDQFFARKLP